MAFEFDIDKIQDAVETMCHRHKLVLHDVEGNKSFARFQSYDQINEIKKAAGKNIVVVAGINMRRVGDKDDRVLQREMILRFACYAAANGDVNTAKKVAIQKAESIMLDFMTFMEKSQEDDIDNDVECSIWKFLRPENFTCMEIEDQPWLINHYGWDLTIPFGTTCRHSTKQNGTTLIKKDGSSYKKTTL
jgi:hypothetical protein